MFDFRYEYSVDNLPPWLTAVGIAFSILGIIAQWRIFQKAGEPGWKILIPIYNIYIIFKIAWGSGWKFLWLLVPLANVVVAIMLNFKLARSFGKGTSFGFGLLFLMPIFILILAFGPARYIGPDGVPMYTPNQYPPQTQAQNT